MPHRNMYHGGRQIKIVDKKGREWDSLLEYRMALLLDAERIPYKHHTVHNIVYENRPTTVELDFQFFKEHQFIAMSYPVVGLQVKGALSQQDYLKKNELETILCGRIWVVLLPHIIMWEQEQCLIHATWPAIRREERRRQHQAHLRHPRK